MRKYVLLNRDPPYDCDRLTKGILGIPGLLAETDRFRNQMIGLAGAGYRNKKNMEEAEAYSAFLRFHCDQLLNLFKFSEVSEQVKNHCSNITSIANIKYQMGNFYFKNVALPKFLLIITEPYTEDPLSFIENAPDLARCTVTAYNIVISEYYAARMEFERLERLAMKNLKEHRIVWDSMGAGVTLPYAVSMLKIGQCIMNEVADMNRTFMAAKIHISHDSTCLNLENRNFYRRIAARNYDIRSIYENYSMDDIEQEAKMSPVTIGDLPSDKEIILALAEVSSSPEQRGQI